MAQMNVNLAFSADTGKAKAQIAELQSLLSKIAYTGSTTNTTNTLQQNLQEASAAAKELQFHLNNAFNVSTGKFDLSMLDKSLKTSGSNITDLSTKLLGAGATGQQAFVTLAQSISLADQPMLRISKRMQEFAVTMKNTVKWQLSSSMLHGFMGAIQSAYGYAQDLNKSLTDIRIVTGYSADQMAVFAEQANKAAKSLSTTTTDYTNASLIYFQQGLSDAEVAARTDITVKMANAVGESAEVVSEQLTAVWNNFANGSKSLEYYADVMTALGAATASSSDEISEGLSKFSAVAESVGLSYEYATAALTTITSNTRESADVVGNALKTLFARLQGLKLGETLEDGVDLNKYSEALDKAGISIFEQNGELKAMDNILNDMAAKWGTMSNTQQVALAQTVAGVRQYNQLIALMENWDNGDEDSMIANLKTIENADGALQKQADIYADSWEAASKRVQASAEGIYQSLLDDDFFISINNGFANLLGGLDAFIDGAGGVKTVLIGIASIVSTVFANKIPEAIDSMKYNLTVLTKGSEEAYKTIQAKMVAASDEIFKQMDKAANVESGTTAKSAYGTQITYANELTAARGKLAAVSDKMSASERQMADMQLAIIEQTQQEIVGLKQKQELLQSNINNTFTNLEDPNSFLNDDAYIQIEQRAESVSNALKKLFSEDTFQFDFSDIGVNDLTDECQALADKINNEIISALKKFRDEGKNVTKEFDLGKTQIGNKTFSQQLENLQKQLGNLKNDDSIESARAQLLAFINILPEGVRNSTNLSKAISSIKKSNTIDELKASITNLNTELGKVGISAQKASAQIKGIKDPTAIKNLYQNILNLKEVTDETEKKTTVLQNLYQEFKPTHVVRMSEALGSLGGLLGNVTTGFMSLSSAIKALANPDLSGWEKFSAILSSTATLIPTVLSGLSNWAKLSAYGSQVVEKENIALAKKIALQTLSNADGINYYKGTIEKSKAFVKSLNDENKEKLASIIADYTLKKSKGEVTKEVAKATVAKIADMMASTELKGAQLEGAAASILEAGSNQMLAKSLWDVVKAKVALMGKAALVALAIAAVVTIIWAAVKAYNADAEAAKKAAEAAKQAQENFKETKEAYDNLISDIESIDQAKKSLDEMTKGTDEWTNAMLELNAQVMELINLYPQLAAAVKSVDGVLTIDKESQAYKDFINQQQQQVLFAQQSAYGAQMRSNEAINQSKYTDLGRDIYYTSGEGEETTISTLPSHVIESVVKGYLDKGADIFNTDGLRELGIYNEDMIPAIISAQDSIMELAVAIQANTTANQLYAEQIAASYLQNNEQYKDSQYQDEINKAVANDMLTPGEGIDDSWSSKYIDENGFALNDKQVQQAYAELMGYQWVKNGWGTGTYLNQAGQNVEINDETARYALNQQKWLEENTSGVTQEVTDVFNSLPEEMRGLIQSAIDGTKLTDEQLAIEGDAAEYLGEYANQLISIFGEDIIPIIQSAIDQTVQTQQDQFDLAGWKSDYQSKMSAVGEIDEYGRIDAEDYALLAEEYSEYFDVQADGSAILNIKASEFKSIVEGIELGKLKEEIANLSGQRQDTINDVSEVTGWDEEYSETRLNSAAQAWTKDGITESYAQNQLNTEHAQALANSLEIDLTQYDSAIEKINALGQAWLDLNNNLNTNQQAIASTATSFDELNNMLNAGTIDVEEYNAALDSTIAKEAEANDLDYENILNYAEYLSENADALENVDDALKDNLADSKKVATSIAKLNKAVKTMSDNWEDWNKAIKSGDMNQINEYLPEINESLKDMLDLTDETFANLSDDFAIKNWDLIKDVVNGVEGSLEKLQVAASQDMILKIKPELDGTDTYNQMSSLLNDLSTQAMGANLKIEPQVDNANALDAFVQLCESAGMTATQIASILQGIGWEPKIEYEELDVEGYADQESFGYQQVAVLNPDGSYRTETVDLAGAQRLAQDGKVYVPKIVSATKTGGGSGSYTPQKTGGNGGGGGGSKPPKHAEKKNDSDKERYHTLNNQLEDLESQYDSISDAADRAFGQDKLDNLDKQIEKTQELIDKNEEYLAEAEKNASIDKSVMEAYYNKSIGGPAIQYDENGNITNFDEIQDAAYAKYNQMAETYDEESNEWIQFEKDYEQFMKYLELYEESTDLVRDKKAEAERLAAEKIDLELEKVQYSIEIQLEVPEDQLKVIDFQLERIEDDAFNSAESMNLLIQKANLFNREIETTKQGLIDTLGVTLSDQEINQILSGDMDGIDTSKFTEDQVSAIREYKDSLLELNQELLDIQQQIEDEVMETFEEYHEELDRGMEKFDHYNNMLESYQNIVDIVGKDVLGLDNEVLADISEAQVENSINQLKASKDAYDSLQKQADDALQKQQEAEMKAALARAKGDEETAKSYEEDAEFWKETYTEMNEAAVEAQEEMMDNWGNTLEAIATQFELAVERAVEAFNDAIYEFGGLEGMSDDFSRQKEMDDMYLEDYQQIYELSKLTRDINNTIDDTENIAGKQKLKKLLEEINQLQEDGLEMSEYDLEYLQAEYNLRLAEIELEEAQKAKDTVRLQRDNEGNWSYVYTQNNDAVDAAQQKYEDALYAMQDLSSNYIDEMSELMISTTIEMNEAINAIDKTKFASQEEYLAEVNRIKAQYIAQLEAQDAELNKAVKNNETLYNTDWTNYSKATGYKISATEDFVTKYSDSLLGTILGSEEATSNFSAIIGGAADTLVNELGNIAATYYTNINTAMQAAGTSTGAFADLLAEDIEAIKTESAAAATAVQEMATKMDEEMTKITERVQKFQEDYGKEIDKIVAKNLEMVEDISEAIAKLSLDADELNINYSISKTSDEEDETVEVPEGTASGYTGMYTGDWGSKEGRVAVLHEKELLLNQDDTVNMLEALKVSKYMLEILNANTQMMSQGMGSLFPASVDNSVSEILEQQVSIVAEFPNAVNHSEIEEAFDTLINRAAQYANRK